MKPSWIKIVIIGAAMAIGFGSYLISQKPDNIVEQAAEAVLRTQGVDIDLSQDDDSKEMEDGSQEMDKDS